MREHHHAFRYEYLGPAADVAEDPEELAKAPAAWASDRGAETRGLAGTTRRAAVSGPAGLATLAGDAFGGGPAMPMVPRTWESDRPESGEGGDAD